jgi:hypothetical protein
MGSWEGRRIGREQERKKIKAEGLAVRRIRSR